MRLLAGALLPALVPAQGPGLERALEQAEALGVRTGVAVIEADGAVHAMQRADEAFAPASNMKLVTAAAVLAGLGSDYEFTTRCRLQDGRLVLRAGGDPNWISGTEHAPEQMFAMVVAALQRHAVRAVRGIDLDAGCFLGPMRPPTWPQDQLDTYYCAPTGPFVLEQGTFALQVQAGGDAAQVALLAPAVHVPIQGHIAMQASRQGAVYGAVDVGAAVRVNGRFWQKSPPVKIRSAVRDPGAWFALALEQALAAAGIEVDAAAPAATCDLVELRTPLRAALRRMLEDSSNFDAEQCQRVLGAQRGDGSLAGGVAATTAQIAELLGGRPAGLGVVDGSGLSRDNRVTPRLLASILAAMLRRADAPVFVASLPTAGSSGTLEGRFAGSPVIGRVHAKTGWIRGVSALSGLLQRRNGSRCLFAILMNYDPAASGQNHQLKRLQETIVEALDQQPVGG